MTTESAKRILAICALLFVIADFIRLAMSQSESVTKAKMSRKSPLVL